MAERASMPLFVPRTVASFERAATVVARRVAAPVRMLATRALSFADRLVGNWTSGASGGAIEGGARTTMRAATRGGDMLMPRPWYEVDADEDAIWPQQAARSAAASAARAAGVQATAAAATTTATAAAAERGAAIARTALTAAPDVVARAIDAADDERPGALATSAVAVELRAAEALGLRASATTSTTATATPTATWAPAARATTPLGRALAHAAWVDAQLRTVSAPVETAARGGGGYVFVAPVDVERSAEGARDAATAAATRQAAGATPPAASSALMTATTTATASARGVGDAAAMAGVAGWSPVLPDPRLPATMPTAIAQRVADFVARLVGVQSARDVAPVEAAPVPVSDWGATPIEARPVAERTFVVLAPPARPASWRPGAAAARVEQLGARVDARVSAAWGVPMAAGVATERRLAAGAFAPAAATTSSATTTVPDTTACAAAERIYVAPVDATARATGPARLSQFMQQLIGVQSARATAPLPVQALIAAQAAASESVRTTSAPTAIPATTAVPGGATAPVMAASGRAPARVTLAATTATTTSESRAIAASMTPAGVAAPLNAATTMAPGAIGRRAEQLGGLVGVRAASLSIDFVDPARLSLLSAAPPSMPTVTPTADAPARDTIMPAPQPLFATTAPSRGAPTLTAEEWSLVATFPSAATAVQLAAARQAAQWSGGTATARAQAAPVRTMLAAIAADRAINRGLDDDGVAIAHTSVAASAARGGAPTEYVAPTVAAMETQGRLPGGRTPRGSFTWPKLAEYVPSRAEWTAPVAVALAEQTKQVAPGTPLWGALPALIAVSPSLAASGFGDAAAGVATSVGSGRAESFAGAREVVRGDATSMAARGAAAGATGARAAALGDGSPRDAGLRGGGVVEAASMRDFATATREAISGDAGAAAGSTRQDAPAMTLMTAAATREARAAARMGARDAADSDAGGDERGLRSDGRAPMPLGPGADPTRPAVAVSNVRPAAAMPLMTGGPAARDGAGRAAGGPTARALELARPFLRLVEGGITGDAGAQRSSGAPRFFEQPQPVVAGAPSSDSASRIVEALRSQPAAASSDDRVSLADLTLIAIASATQQVAASAQGGGPSSSSASPSPAAAAPAAEAAHGGKSENPVQEIEELARAAFDELQRLFAMARERSGEHG